MAKVQLEESYKLKNQMVLLAIEPLDLSACSRLVPQPTSLPHAPVNLPWKEGTGQFLMVFLTVS
jgi:hypothetical protein